jgi:VPDSG-CTERM motif
MKLSKTLLAVLGTAALVSGLISQSAQAVPITGSIGFNGTGFGTQGSGGTPSSLTFNNPMTVDIRTGSYASVPMGTTANFSMIQWTGSGTSAVLFNPAQNSPEWIFTINPGGLGAVTYSFNLTQLTAAAINNGAVSLQGTGVAFITGTGGNTSFTRDPTFASFSVQGTGSNFTFEIVQTSTSANGIAVPDGGSAIALLGLAVMGLEVVRRKLRTA